MYQNHWLNLLLLADVKIDWIIQHADQQVDTAASQPNDHLLCTDASMHGLAHAKPHQPCPSNTNQPGSPTPQSIDLVLDKRH